MKDVGDNRAREKTSQALREGAPIIRLLVAQCESVGGTEYEFVASCAGGEDELDELEAEIAAALGD